MYLVFALDTTLPMNQKMDELSFLDCSKNAIEFMYKVGRRHNDSFIQFHSFPFQLRQKDVSSRSLDKYLLVTSGSFPQCIKSFVKESHLSFLEELKNITATDIGSPLFALNNAFKVLNLLRLQASADHYAQGLYPGSFDNSVIVYFSSGCWHKESVIQVAQQYTYLI